MPICSLCKKPVVHANNFDGKPIIVEKRIHGRMIRTAWTNETIYLEDYNHEEDGGDRYVTQPRYDYHRCPVYTGHKEKIESPGSNATESKTSALE